MKVVSPDEVVRRRGPRYSVDAAHPYAVVSELEADGRGDTVPVTAVFLTAAECPLRCAMCDLWKHTLPTATPAGAIPQQLRQALQGRPRHGWLKLYNSGSFFDPRSIPTNDHESIASLCDGFDRVIVENHPRFGAAAIARFASLLAGRLEIAVGLESVQPGLLRRLNKRMSRDDFDRFARRLAALGIDLRVFLMLRPPWTDEEEAIRWTLLSIKHAMAHGARHISIIPARDGNGWMDEARRQGMFTPPSPAALESTLERSLTLAQQGSPNPLVTVDLWDWDRLCQCPLCATRRRQRLEQINLRQRVLPSLDCPCCEERRR